MNHPLVPHPRRLHKVVSEMTEAWFADFLLATIRAAVPLVFCALGVLLSERAGVWNIGVEGTMLAGALVAVLTAIVTGNVWLALVFTVLIGFAVGALQGVFTVFLPADQVVVGIAINLTSLGATSFAYKIMINKGIPLAAPRTLVSTLPGLREAPVIGFFASISPLAYLAIGLVILTYYFLFRTGPGLLLRSLGESAHAAHAAGINVNGVRYLTLAVGSAMAALGGAALTLAWVPSFTDNITMGRGFIALAAVYFGRWNPVLALAATLLFGAGEALAFRAQAAGVGLNPFYYMMMPYMLTLLVVGLTGRAVGPKDSGNPFIRR